MPTALTLLNTADVEFSGFPALDKSPDFSQLLQAAVEQAFNAVVITTAELDGDGPRITYCNPAFCTMTGYAMAELLGQSPSILQGPLTDPKLLQRLRECLHGGQFFHGATFNYRKDGSTYMVEWNISPIFNAQGKIQAFVSVQQDITTRFKSEQRQALLCQALHATQDTVLIADQHAQIVFVNQAFENLTGYCSEEVLGRTPKFLQSGHHLPEFYTQLRSTLKRGESSQATFANRHKSGRLYYAEQTITPLKDATGTIMHYVCVSKDVTELILRTQELRQQAHHDVLTGLLNRRAGEKQLEQCQQAAHATQQGYALILADIDNFKQINDQFGHEVGDQVLQRSASLLSTLARSSDTVARWGGEEFLIILPGCSIETAQKLAERMRSAVAAQDVPNVGYITMSLGVAAWQPPEECAQLLRRADNALYLAKGNGRNQVALAS